MLPFEKKTIKFYNFFFEGKDKPLIVEADNLQAAMDYLVEGFAARGLIGKEKLVNHTVTTPIFGITEKEEDGVVLVWVGFDESETGWMDQETFKNKKYNF